MRNESTSAIRLSIILLFILLCITIAAFAETGLQYFFGLSDEELQDFLDEEWNGTPLRYLTMNEALFEEGNPAVVYGYDFSDDSVWTVTVQSVKQITGEKIGKQVINYIRNNPDDFDDLLINDEEISTWYNVSNATLKNTLLADWFDNHDVLDMNTEDAVPQLRELILRAIDLYQNPSAPSIIKKISTWGEKKWEAWSQPLS